MRLGNLFIFIGLTLFILNWIQSKELSIVDNFVSDFVHTSRGFLTTIGFLLIGIGVIVIIFHNTIAISLLKYELYIFGILYINMAIFPVDKPGKLTCKGIIHTISAHLCFEPFSIIILFLIFSSYITDIIIIILTITSFLGGILMIFFKRRYKGIFQRASIISQILVILLLFR